MGTLIPRWIFMQLPRSIWREYLENLLWNLPYAFVKINIKLCCASLLHMHLTIRISNTYWKSYVPCIFRWILALESWYIRVGLLIWSGRIMCAWQQEYISNIYRERYVYLFGHWSDVEGWHLAAFWQLHLAKVIILMWTKFLLQ